MKRKSLPHLLLQLHIKCAIQGIILEKSFPEIRRIADVVWEEKKLIFEIQCSPITVEEVNAREIDYASLGYQVVWILHEGRFNRKTLTPAELILRQKPCYYANKTEIYDQFEVVLGKKRKFKGAKLPIDLTNPLSELPLIPLEATRNRSFGFQGDLVDLSSKQESLFHLQRLERRKKLSWRKRKWIRTYRLLLERVLDLVLPE